MNSKNMLKFYFVMVATIALTLAALGYILPALVSSATYEGPLLALVLVMALPVGLFFAVTTLISYTKN